MRVAINQPYFFPYLGYFSLIKHTNRFLLVDEVQFIKQGWIERNRILMPEGGWRYIRVPLLKHAQKDIIKDIRINNQQDWRPEIFKHLGYYKNKAPYYKETILAVEKALDVKTDSITKLNEHILKTVCGYLGLYPDISILSEMNLWIQKPEAPDEWPLHICKSLGNIDEYWNPEGGAEFYDRSKFEEADIGIRFLKIDLAEYPQIGPAFVPGLSIIDVMMFNEPEQINKMIDRFTLI